MTEHVYHFTDTAHLPWILTAGELRPGLNRVGNYPSPEFLWATIDSRGDRSAAASKQGVREGVTRLVRFTLAAEDFEPWPAACARFPQWTPEKIEKLERTGKARGSSPLTWHCRVDPLPANKWLSIETKKYTGTSWQTLQSRDLVFSPDTPDAIGVLIDQMVYMSAQILRPGLPMAYAIRAPQPLSEFQVLADMKRGALE